MEKKSPMSRVERLHREKVTRYSIRKYSFGAASVAVAALFMFLGNGAVSANELSKQETSLAAPGLASEHEGPQEAESASVVAPVSDAPSTPAESVPAAQPVVEEPAKPAAPEVTTPALDKKQLENYISEVKSKLSAGTYANKTEDSLALLNGELASAESTLASATSQDELNVAYRNLVTTVSSKLKNKPKDSKDAPKVDTTNGQPTVGKKAENTEPKSESNAIENSGSHDSRNRKEIDKENAFRTEATAKTHEPYTRTEGNISYTVEFSDDAKKEIYAYNEEDTNIEISVNSTAGKISKTFVKGASGQYLDRRPIGSAPNQEETDGWGWTYHSVLTPTQGPVTVRVTGKPNDKFKGLSAYTKQENQHAVLGDRYLQVYDEADGKIEAGGNAAAAGFFKMVVKSQTYKYSIQQPENNANKIAVSDINNLTETDIQKIKNQIKLGYSTTSQDARLESKKGQALDNQASVVKSINVDTANKKVVVTYNDDSTDEASLASVARTDLDPVVEFPFSDAPKREIYVYGAEENSFDIKIKDDADKIKSATLLQWGSNPFKPVEGEPDKVNTQYGYTANVISSETPATEAKPAVITYSGTPAPEGSFTQAKLEAATKGENPPGVALGWRYLKVVDSEGKEFVGSGKETANNMSLRVMLKPQTQKYDIQTPAEADKVAVDDASEVTEAEFNKIKEKLKIEYSKNNMDARLADKKGQAVENQEERIASIKKDGNNLVVTYKDGSTDTRPLTDFARTNNAPEVTIPYSVDGKKDVYVYANEDFDIPVKYTDDSGKIASATIKRGGNQDSPAKDESNPDILDNEYNTTVEKISTETVATAENPAIVKIKGNISKDNSGIAESKFPKEANQELKIVTRYATATDTDGKEIHNVAKGSSYATDPGSFTIKLKAQTAKYDIRELADADKTVVTDIAHIPEAELTKLKENLPLEYSKKNEDKNLEDKKGKAVEAENAKKVVKDLVQDGENLVVTYQDGSKDTIPVDKVVKLDKQPAIDAVTTEADNKIEAIKQNTNLTKAEQDKAIADVEKDKAAALEKIADATNATDVTAGKDEGTGAVAKVNPIGKEKAKEEIAKTLEAKKEAIANNDSLTQAEKEKAKKDAEDKAAAALAEIEKQPATAETAAAATAAQTIVNDKQAEGTEEVAKINPIGKQAALDKIDEALKAKEAEMDARTDLTEEEKAEAKEQAKQLADAKKAVINGKNDNAETPEAAEQEQGEIDTAGDTGKTEVEGVKKPAAKKPEAKTAVETTADAKKQEIAQDAALTEEARAKLQAEVDAVKKASEEAIDGAKKNADVEQAKKSAEAAIKAINSARLPANKVIAENPSALNEDERKKLEDAIKAVNPPGTKVVVKDDGSAEVTLPGKQAPETLKQEDLTKDVNALDTAGGGNNINRPTDKVIVENPESLTDADKENIKKAVREVNPNAVVTIDDNGTVTVSTPEGNTAGFTAKELVRTLADAANPDSGNAGVRKPADKLVGDATNADLQAKATEKLKKLNGGDEKVKAVKYDAEGNATVVLKDGTIATIPAGDLFKTEEDAKKANGGDDINKPNAQTVVEDIAALQGDKLQEVKDAIKAKVEAVNPGAVVVVDDQGNAVVTTPAGKTAVIDADDLIKKPNETSTAKAGNNINNPADRVRVDNSKQLTDPELARIKAAVEAVNPDATVVVDDNGNATVTTKDGKTATIPVADLVKSDADKENVNGGNQVNTPADRVVVDSTDAPLPQEVTDAIKAKIQAVNPDATVVVDEKGNATVTTPEGKTATIPASDLVKAKADLADPAKQDAVNKPADKVVVDPALVDDPNTDLSAAKDAIKAAVEAVNPDSTVVVDDKGNATVTTPEGKTVVIPKADLVKKEADKETAKAGNNINKPADKVVADKDALTPENIAAIKAKVQAVNPGSTVVVDAQGNATVITPEGQTATIPVTDLVKSPEEAKDEKAGNNVNKPADKVAATKADLADDAKKADVKAKIKAAVEAVNPEGSKVFVDDQGNATVTTPDGKTATIPVEDLIKDTTQPNAGNKVNTPATKVVVTDPANIKADEDKIRAEILKVNPGATVAFDEKGNATVTTKDGAVATIPASDLAKDAADLRNPDKQDAVNKPADKTLVKKAGKLTSAEKEAIKKEIAKVNRDPKTTIVVDDEGNATVTTPEGKTVVIAKEDLVKSPQEVDGAKAGNNINKPADKVAAAVADLVGPNKDEVKAKIQKAVEAVNPGATVFVDDQGNATVTTPEGNTATISVDDLLKDPTAKESAKAGNKVNTPAERTVVANPAELTDAEKAKITAAIQAVNPEGTKVVFDEAGNATVTVPNQDGTTAIATIPVSDLVKSNDKKDLLDPAKQNPVKKPIDQTVVANKDALTDEDRKAIKAKVAEVNPDATVFVDEKGNATVTTPDGKTLVIAADDLVKTDDEVLSDPKAGNVINKPADRVFVKDGQITDDVKAKIAAKVQRINPGATVFVDDKGNATVTTPEGKTATIPVKDLTKTDADKAKVNAGNKINSPADRVLVKDRDKLTAEDIQEIEKNILAVNPGATVVFDAKGNATVKNANGDIATIPVEALAKPKADLLKPEKQDLIKKPVDKVLVTDPANLDKEAIKKAVEEVNPGSTVVVDDNGNATITTEDGRSFVIPAKDLVKTAEEAKNAKAGNNINKPADKVVVADPTKPLSPEEKKAIEAKIKAVNPDAKAIFVDDKGNATVTIEDKDGNTETATIPAADLVTSPEEAKQPNAGNKVNTPADKVVVSDPDHLSDEDKAKITEAIKAVNPEAKVAFDDKGNATVTTKDGEVATIPAADLVKTPEEATKPNAGNNVNTPADKVAVDSTKPLTEDEKKAIAAKVAEVNPGATVAVDDQGNATVTVNGKTAVIPAAALTKTADSAKEPNAGNDVVKPADKTVVEDPESLTKDEQDAIAAKVAEVNPEAKTVVVDDQGNATVTTKDGKTVVIPAKDLVKTAEEAAKPNAGNDVNTPADKTVLDPNDLEASKKAIEDKVKAVNPGATVVVDDQGNATVTTKDGKVAVIPAKDLTKTADSAKEPNAGNDVVKPADKTVVANPDSLTKDEKEAIIAKVKAVNPDATVVVDDQGNATVTPKDGKPVVIPASDLTKSPEEAAKPNAGNDIVKPADKTVVANPESLTPEEKEAIVAKVAAVNPGAEVVVDDQGNATVTVNGKTAIIPAADLTKNADAEKAPKAGNDIVKPASKTKVANPDSLTPEEKKAIADKVTAVNPGSTVVVDDKGNATVTLPNGNTAVIPASDLTKSEKDVNDGKAKDNAVTPAAKTKVANPNALTPEEKKAIEDKVKAANPGATVVVDDKGNATVVKDGNVSVIPSTDLVKVEDDATKPNGGNDANTPAAKTVVADSTKLTDEEKAAVKKAVAAVNPGSTVVVDDKGNATVTKGDGTVLNIPASDLVIPAEKLADEAKNAKVKTPAIRTLVGNKENLTKDEKDAVKKAIEAVNPGATVVVDDKGNATVTMPDGSTATISKEQLVKNAEEAKAKNGGNNLDFDLSKVTVANLANITPEEKAKFQFKVLGAITNVEEFDLDAYIKSTDKDGNTVYTSKDSNVTITIDKDGNMKVTKDGKTDLVVNIDEEGNVTIVTKEGQVLAIPRDDAFKQYVPYNAGGNNGSGNGNGTSGNNGATNTAAKVDKAKLEGAIHQLDELFIQESAKLDAENAKEATDLLADAKKVFADPKASQDEVDAMVKRIEDFMAKVAPATDHATPAKDQAAQTSAVAPATAQAANANQAAANARKAAKELPNTGTADSTVAMVAATASALLGLGLAGRRRKEDEEA
ncbi:surface anchored protein [Streptococcus pneumoniae]|nr:surface anchored protein [Streptococcus pneumoniae]